MTQIARVKNLLADGRAEVGIHRKSACSHDCNECAGCETTMTQSDITLTVENRLGAHPGDIVMVESANSDILGAAVVVYLVPFLIFFVGYFISQTFSFGEGLSMGIACAGFIAGLLPARWLERRVSKRKSLQFHMVEIKKSCSDM